MKYYLPILLIWLLATSGYAQSAKKLFRDASQLFEQSDYTGALHLYLQGLKLEPDNTEAHFRTGVCYLETIYKEKALSHLINAYQKMPAIHPDIQLYMGEAYQYNHNFAEAMQAYGVYKQRISTGKDVKMQDYVNRKIYECQNGINYLKQPVSAQIDNIGAPVNTRFPEYAPVISADESVLVFTSRRDGSTGGELTIDDNQFYEDVYISYREGSKWSEPRNIREINTNRHDACIALSPDGKQLFIYRDDKGGDIYLSSFDAPKKQWSKPKSMGDPINTKYQEPSISMTADGNTVYFSSNRPGGLGGLDVYMSRKDAKGNWGEAINLGAPINTPFDDDAPFIHADSKTLYFSSRGHAGMGGYDIYRSTLETNTTWSAPENLGYPINTAGDDIYFVLSADNQHGYYASAKEGGRGEKDIYVISMPKPKVLATVHTRQVQTVKTPVTTLNIQKPTIQSTSATTILKGIITDAITGEPLEAAVTLTDNETGEAILEQNSEAGSGTYSTVMLAGKNYALTVQKDNYLFHSENYTIPSSNSHQEITLNIALKRISVGSRIVLRNIFFDFDKATLKKESLVELEKLLALLKEVPSLRIEIAGHTDNQGSTEYNQKLSERRAKSVVDYLIGKGIAAERLRYAGYGLTRPLVSNDDEEGRQINRRTEFEIISN